jgi:hypothetical protein
MIEGSGEQTSNDFRILLVGLETASTDRQETADAKTHTALRDAVTLLVYFCLALVN